MAFSFVHMRKTPKKRIHYQKCSFLLYLALCALFAHAQTEKNLNLQIWQNTQNKVAVRLDAAAQLLTTNYTENPDSGLYIAEQMLDMAQTAHADTAIHMAYIMLGKFYVAKSEYVKALEHYNASYILANQMQYAEAQAISQLKIGQIYTLFGNHVRSADLLSAALKYFEAHNDTPYLIETLRAIAEINLIQQNFEKATNQLNIALNLVNKTENDQQKHLILVRLGYLYTQTGNFEEAQKIINQNIALSRQMGEQGNLAKCLGQLAQVFKAQGDKQKAYKYLLLAQDIYRTMPNPRDSLTLKLFIADLDADFGRINQAKKAAQQVLEISKTQHDLILQLQASEMLYRFYKKNGQIKEALSLYEFYVAAQDSLQSSNNQREIIRQENLYNFEKKALSDSLATMQMRALDMIQIEKSELRISRQRLALGSAAIGILLLLALTVAILSGKRKSDKLLLNILPKAVAAELKEKGSSDSKLFKAATVIFTDFKGFTALSEILSPHDLVAELNECFTVFDKIMEQYGIEKIKTIGDSYMAACGLPEENAKHAENIIHAAIEIKDFMQRHKNEKMNAGLPFFETRIGIHSGPVVAGIVGTTKFQYDIWGDTVNIASRMEACGHVAHINISQTTYDLVASNPHFAFTARGKIEAKGKGEMHMYFVTSAPTLS